VLCGARMTRLHRSEFLREAKELFPGLRPALNREYGLLNLEMHAFCELRAGCHRYGDRETVTKAFAFCTKLLAQGNSDMVNALTGRSWTPEFRGWPEAS